MRFRSAAVAWASIPIALAAWVFAPLLGNYFHEDDFVHLFDIVDVGLLEFALKPFAMHMLTVRNVVMFGIFEAFGPDARATFAVVLLTHLLNVLLLFAAVLALGRGVRAAVFAATLWGTAPVLEGSLGWYTVYGHVLVGNCLLIALLCLARPLREGRPLGMGRLLASFAAAIAASACFGIGLGVAMAFPIAVLLLFPSARLPPGGHAVLALGAVATLAIYVADAWWKPTGSLDASLDMARAVTSIDAVRPVLRTMMGLFEQGSAELLAGLLKPLVAPAAWLGPAALALLAAAAVTTLVLSPPPERRLAAALVWLAVACYAPVALAKGSLFGVYEATPQILATQMRYHYASLIPLAILLALLAEMLGRGVAWSARLGTALLAAWLVLLAAVHVRHPPRFDHYDKDRRAVAQALADIRSKVSEAAPGAEVIVPDLMFPPTRIHSRLGTAALFLIHHPSGELDGRRVRFTVNEKQYEWVSERSRRAMRILVAP